MRFKKIFLIVLIYILIFPANSLLSKDRVCSLSQPYMISSLRLLLWDCDDRSYSYYIESSVNVWDWEMVADYTRENCKSWQEIRFPQRPVVFIRIVGTRNTANEVFHCVHFECPYIDSEGNQQQSSPSCVRNISINKDIPPVDANSLQNTETATEAEEV